MRQLLCLLALLSVSACASAPPASGPPSARSDAPLAAVGFNLDHLDFLGEDVVHEGDTLRLVHIYAEAPDWRFVGDDDEGIACVDDAARAAVVYLRHYERTGDERSRRQAAKLLRFVRHLQAESGLFYNFVWDRDLRINTEHANSVADSVSWWTARAVWALGEGARVLAEADPAEAAAAAAAVRRVEPHLDRLLARYPAVADENGRPFPQWLIAGTAADATSELLLGLVALQEAEPTDDGARRVRRFAEGLSPLRFGDLGTFPYGGHASWTGGWHGWGNSQTQALAEAARLGLAGPEALASAEAEAQSLYARLLVEGWLHNLDYATGDAQTFEQIAYDVRPAAVGLVRLFEATGDERYAVMAGLAASWFHGANPAGVTMADPATGRGYDGILAPDRTNPNAGAESTIEAQFALLEVAAHPEAAAWAWAAPEPPRTLRWDGRTVRARTFSGPALAVVVLDPEAGASHVFTGPEADRFLASAAPSP
ncbi:hypothetical protein [Rubrivirga marina]|uniref:Uncharacterized protein n=1 Tax=Rubrivirga marina TaxID=1196024 RepID=A0A271IVV2_9BACT|nr:hypothetical protein [Rubrivirga marina]PAP75376.1 hypothetical protein BSZ37_02405 [Rubrivirga marina]